MIYLTSVLTTNNHDINHFNFNRLFMKFKISNIYPKSNNTITRDLN